MLHSRDLNYTINSVHERTLIIVYGDKIDSFQIALEKDISVSIHQRNLQLLATEILKVYNNVYFLKYDIFSRELCPLIEV